MFTGSSRISVCPSTKRKIEKDGDRNNKICSSEADNNNKSDLVFRSTKNFLLVRAPSIFEANHWNTMAAIIEQRWKEKEGTLKGLCLSLFCFRFFFLRERTKGTPDIPLWLENAFLFFSFCPKFVEYSSDTAIIIWRNEKKNVEE